MSSIKKHNNNISFIDLIIELFMSITKGNQKKESQISFAATDVSSQTKNLQTPKFENVTNFIFDCLLLFCAKIKSLI